MFFLFHNEAQGGRARAPARPAAAGPAPVPSAGGSRRTGPAPLGVSFIYALLSKNAVNRGFLRFNNSEVLPSPSDKKAVINFLL